ncbi:MAG: NADH peroxidase [Dehalococcoidia bacterium]|nr:NADH peroxidase [Bacillota bacterium]MBT9143837.1 NADH peroxidase [Bacillota bacterium]
MHTVKLTETAVNYSGAGNLKTIRAIQQEQTKKSRISEKAERVLINFDPDFSALVHKELLREGVFIHTGEPLRAFLGEERLQGVRTDKGEYPCDLAVLSSGVRPNCELAGAAGIKTGFKEVSLVVKKMSRGRKNKIMVYIVIAIAGGGLVLSSILAAFLPGNMVRSSNRPALNDENYIADLERRIAQFKANLEQSPDNFYLLANLGHAYFDLGRVHARVTGNEKAVETYVQAVEVYQRALLVNPDDVDVRVNLAIMAFWSDKLDLAQEQFNKAIELNPNHAKAHYSHAVFLYFGRNNPTGAIESWNKVIELNPADAQELVTQARGFIAQVQSESNALRGDPNQFNLEEPNN